MWSDHISMMDVDTNDRHKLSAEYHALTFVAY